MNLSTKNSRSKGATVVEVVVVFFIVVILLSVFVSALIGYIDNAIEKTKGGETEAVVESAKSAITKVYSLGMPIEEINSNNKAVQNLRSKILYSVGARGEIVGFHVSDGTNAHNRTNIMDSKPAPLHLDFTKAGTLEFLEYRGNNGKWYGQYRVFPDKSSEIRILDSPQGGPGVTIKND